MGEAGGGEITDYISISKDTGLQKGDLIFYNCVQRAMVAKRCFLQLHAKKYIYNISSLPGRERLLREGPAPCRMRGGTWPRAQPVPQPLHGLALTCDKAAAPGAPGGAGAGGGPRTRPPPPLRAAPSLPPAAPRGQPRPGGPARGGGSGPGCDTPRGTKRDKTGVGSLPAAPGDAEPHVGEREILVPLVLRAGLARLNVAFLDSL